MPSLIAHVQNKDLTDGSTMEAVDTVVSWMGWTYSPLACDAHGLEKCK